MFNTNVFEGWYSKGCDTWKKLNRMNPDTFYNFCQQLKIDKGLTIQYWWSQDKYEVKKISI